MTELLGGAIKDTFFVTTLSGRARLMHASLHYPLTYTEDFTTEVAIQKMLVMQFMSRYKLMPSKDGMRSFLIDHYAGRFESAMQVRIQNNPILKNRIGGTPAAASVSELEFDQNKISQSMMEYLRRHALVG